MQKLQVVRKREEESDSVPSVAPNLRNLPQIGQSDSVVDALPTSIFVAAVAAMILLIGGVSLIQASLISFGFLILTFSILQAIDRRPGKSAHRTQADVAYSDEVQSEQANLWYVYSSCDEVLKPDRIALISTDTEQSRIVGSDLAEHGFEVHHSTDREAMLDCVQCQPEKWKMVIFDLDAAPDLETAIDELMDFRAVCSEIPVLLLSGGSQRNEFSCHRRLIGDATLCKPVFRTRLIEGVEIARLNAASGP